MSRHRLLLLQCLSVAAQMRLIAFITEARTVEAALTHLGEYCNMPGCNRWFDRELDAR